MWSVKKKIGERQLLGQLEVVAFDTSKFQLHLTHFHCISDYNDIIDKKYKLLLLIYNCNIHYMPLYNNPGGGGETAHMKGVEMLVVSLRGVNFGF